MKKSERLIILLETMTTIAEAYGYTPEKVKDTVSLDVLKKLNDAILTGISEELGFSQKVAQENIQMELPLDQKTEVKIETKKNNESQTLPKENKNDNQKREDTKVVTHPASTQKEKVKEDVTKTTPDDVIDPSVIFDNGVQIIVNALNLKKSINKEGIKKEIKELYVSFGHETNIFVTSEKDREILYNEMYEEALRIVKEAKLNKSNNSSVNSQKEENKVAQTTENSKQTEKEDNSSTQENQETTTQVTESENITEEMQAILDDEDNNTQDSDVTDGPEDDSAEIDITETTTEDTVEDDVIDGNISEEDVTACKNIQDLTALIGREFAKGYIKEDDGDKKKEIVNFVKSIHHKQKNILHKNVPAKDGVIDNVIYNTLAGLFKKARKSA